MPGDAEPAVSPQLTPPEEQLLALIREGRVDAEIAVRLGITNRNVMLGVLFEAIFFGALLVLLARADVSLIWPLTSIGFVLTTAAAKFLRHEEVTTLRQICPPGDGTPDRDLDIASRLLGDRELYARAVRAGYDQAAVTRQ